MKVSCEGVLVFTLACLVGGLHNGVQGQKCCNQDDRRLCFGRCEAGYYQDGEANETLTCASTTTTVNPAPSANSSSTTTTTTTTTSTSTTAPLPAVFCSKCADGCKICNGSSNAECWECFDNFYNSTENGTIVCRKKEEEDGYPIPLIVGVTVGSVVVVAVVVGLVVFFCRRGQRRRTFGGQDQELGRGMGINDDDSTDSDTAPEGKSNTRKERNDETPRVNTRKIVEEPTYINVQTHSQRPTSIENSHDKVLRYTRDPTLKAGKPAYNRSQSEEEELQKLPEAPRLPVPKTSPLPPDDVYEINGDEPTDVKKLTAAPPRHAPIEYEVVDSPGAKPAPSTKPKPKPIQKPAPKPQTKPKKPIPASEKADASPQPSYEPLQLPISGGGRKPKTGGKKGSKAIIGGAASKGRGDGGRRKTEGSLPSPSSPVSCPANLPQFPVEEAEEEERKKQEQRAEEERKKKKQQAARKKEQEQKSKSLPPGRRPNDDDVSDPEDGYENAPDKKKLPRFASSPARPKPLSLSPAAGTDSEPEGEYENEESLLALKSGRGKVSGTKNPAAETRDAEDSDPQEVYGNQDVIDEEQGRQSGKGYYNTTRARASVGASGDASGPEDEYEEMSGTKTDDDDLPVYGNEVSDEDEPAYQNIAAISPRRKT